MRRRSLLMSLSAMMVIGAVAPAPSSAQTLSEIVPTLINQAAIIARPVVLTNPQAIDTTRPDLSRSFVPGLSLTTVPSTFNAALAMQLGTRPLGPTAGTVIYSRDGRGPEMHSTFGGAYADRGLPLGKGKIGLALSFQNDMFNSFDGVDLNGRGVNFLFANAGPSPDLSDILQETISIRLNRKVTSFNFNYGATSRWDIAAVVPIVQVAMDVRVSARVVRVRSTLDKLQSCAGVPARNAGNGPALLLCQDPHGFDNVLTLGTLITYLDVDLRPGVAVDANNYGTQGRTARGVGDILFRTKYALVAAPSGALAVTLDASLPTGNKDNFLGSGAYRLRPGVVWSGSAGRISPHVSAGYTFVPKGDLSSKLQATAPAALDLSVPEEINFAAGFDAAVAPRTTLVVDFFGRTLRDVQRFAVGTTVFASGSPTVPADAAAAQDLIADGRGDLMQMWGIVGGRIHLGGAVFANGSVMFSALKNAGLSARPSAVFSIDYGF